MIRIGNILIRTLAAGVEAARGAGRWGKAALWAAFNSTKGAKYVLGKVVSGAATLAGYFELGSLAIDQFSDSDESPAVSQLGDGSRRQALLEAGFDPDAPISTLEGNLAMTAKMLNTLRQYARNAGQDTTKFDQAYAVAEAEVSAEIANKTSAAAIQAVNNVRAGVSGGERKEIGELKQLLGPVRTFANAVGANTAGVPAILDAMRTLMEADRDDVALICGLSGWT